MSIDVMAHTSPAPQPTPHPAWCQREHCVVMRDGQATHRHLVGEVAGVQVWMERSDTGPAVGEVEVRVFSDASFPLGRDSRDTMMRLVAAAGMFADEVEGAR